MTLLYQLFLSQVPRIMAAMAAMAAIAIFCFFKPHHCIPVFGLKPYLLQKKYCTEYKTPDIYNVFPLNPES